MSFIRVIRPGLQTTVQDVGRWGWQASGVSVAGAMDPCSLRVANALVGNEARAAALEVTLLGPELEFEDDRVVAMAGARFEMSLNGRPVQEPAFAVAAGSRLQFGTRRSGARAYLAIDGGVAVPEVLGSRATHVVSHLGGFAGRALTAGDRLPLGPASGRTASAGHVPGLDVSIDPVAGMRGGHGCLRVIPGPHADWFDSTTIAALAGVRYEVTSQSNRMGYRLEGPAIPWRRDAEVISSGTTIGALQVPRSGQPILLMSDRQTSGGYPTIATVIVADLGVAGQLAPGDSVEFAACTLDEALLAARAQEEALLAVERGAQS